MNVLLGGAVWLMIAACVSMGLAGIALLIIGYVRKLRANAAESSEPSEQVPSESQ